MASLENSGSVSMTHLTSGQELENMTEMHLERSMSRMLICIVDQVANDNEINHLSGSKS